MGEMVERVKKAIEDAFLAQDHAAMSWHPGMGFGYTRPVKIDLIAQAAIAAMREPTEAMEDAPWRAHVQVYEPTDLSQVLDCVSFKRVWQAMIDEALK